MIKPDIRFDILTLFPEAFASFSSSSILKKAIESGCIQMILHDIRQHSKDPHHQVDDTPYGGGAGMVLKAPPIFDAFNSIEKVGKKRLRIFLTPQGRPFTAKLARELSEYDQLILLAGHYEGIDQRVRDKIIDLEISIGDYVLTGGELPALIVLDAVSRLVKGVLGNERSHIDESYEEDLLEYPHYTRPAIYKNMKVPKILREGHHEKIKEWRRKESIKRTKKVRPDLFSK